MKDGFFPHGDILYEEQDDYCLWRETSFALHLIKNAIVPEISISKCLKEWRNIQYKLRDKRITRKPKMTLIQFLT